MHTPEPQSGAILVYDGDCLLCNRWVAFVLRHDPLGHFQFTTLHSVTARMRIPDPTQRDGSTLLLITTEGIFIRSTAALKIASKLRGCSTLARLLLRIPQSFRDPIYNFIARHRHSLLPSHANACAFDPDAMRRFLP